MKNKRHNWPEILKHFDKSKLNVPKYAKKYKVAESSLYAKRSFEKHLLFQSFTKKGAKENLTKVLNA